MLSTRNLSIRYGKENVITFPDIDVSQKDAFLIHGPSGCGKTTLLHILAGLIKPLTGTVNIFNQNITNLRSSHLDLFRGTNIGICLQRPIFIQSLSVLENLILAQELIGNKKNIKVINEQLNQLKLINKAHQKTYSLSQGEQQRLMFARALINNPKLILADEPTSALDDTNTNIIIELLKNQCQEHHAALVIVSHDERLFSKFQNKIRLK
ncbi:MAG: ATP-binding cassette domain-containing protein [Saprospiraceae bacterium]|uniref:ATP-binding cassette domain-containing protein n=1 Tax=Candidatus Defluviibacterium haderslevense TaxID=2981993 RepID=A0A9D7XBY4_9BACT|nr:ATP-binding cassette domain-containing protein [Candidatus Defluviibacterium haderslevense]